MAILNGLKRCAGASTRGWRKRRRGNQALGRSHGGFPTKIHLLTDSHGNPLDYHLTGGQVADNTMAEKFLNEKTERNQYAIADKGYDDDKVRTKYELKLKKLGQNR